MDLGSAFLQAMGEAPDDDAPRLIYADWLDERGERDRGEFSRVQCALERLQPQDERRAGLKCREQELRTRSRVEGDKGTA
jgi:uncharacterized protein (TIGR02996 family)